MNYFTYLLLFKISPIIFKPTMTINQ